MRVDGTLSTHYDYDLNGNRLGRTTSSGIEIGAYDVKDRVVTYGGRSFGYTAAGNLGSVTDAGGASTNYSYDAFGNLRLVSLPDGRRIDYEIDAQNHRLGKKINGVRTYGLLYSDHLRPVAMLDANSAIVSTFIYATRTNIPDYMVNNGQTYRFVVDHLGSVRLVVNASNGSIAQRIDYDEFGRVVSDTNPGFQPFAFAGGLYDADTGLVRFGSRDYDAMSGRWTALDPLLFKGGQPNLYVYINQDPINLTDAQGLNPALILLGVFVVGGAIEGGLHEWLSNDAASTTDIAAASLMGAGDGIVTGVAAVAGLLEAPLAAAALTGTVLAKNLGTALVEDGLQGLGEETSKEIGSAICDAVSEVPWECDFAGDAAGGLYKSLAGGSDSATGNGAAGAGGGGYDGGYSDPGAGGYCDPGDGTGGYSGGDGGNGGSD